MQDDDMQDDIVLVVEDHVEAGDNAEDYDHGIIRSIVGPHALVAWRQSVTTSWITVEGLRPFRKIDGAD